MQKEQETGIFISMLANRCCLYLHAAAHLAYAKSSHHYVQHMEELNSEDQYLFEFGYTMTHHSDKFWAGVWHNHTTGIDEGHQHVWMTHLRTRDFWKHPYQIDSSTSIDSSALPWGLCRRCAWNLRTTKTASTLTTIKNKTKQQQQINKQRRSGLLHPMAHFPFAIWIQASQQFGDFVNHGDCQWICELWQCKQCGHQFLRRHDRQNVYWYETAAWGGGNCSPTADAKSHPFNPGLSHRLSNIHEVWACAPSIISLWWHVDEMTL